MSTAKMHIQDSGMLRISEMMQEANRQLQDYFRKSRRFRINRRKGAIIFIDDEPKQVTVLEYLLKTRGINIPVVSFINIDDAKKFIEQNGSEAIRAVILDLNFDTGAENGESMIQWIEDRYNEIPFIISTGYEKEARKIAKRIPGLEVMIKGQTSIEEFSDILGIPNIGEMGSVIPADDNI